MQPNNFERFKAIMAGMGKLYEREMDGPLLDAYWLAFRDWTLDEFESGAAHLMQTSKFMPRPADFQDLRKAGRPTAGEAWLTAIQNSSSAIVCGQVTSGSSCGDPLIDRAVRAIGGYGVIAMCASEKLGFLEKRFAEHFEAMQDADDVREAVPEIASTFRPRLGGPRSIRDLLPETVK